MHRKSVGGQEAMSVAAATIAGVGAISLWCWSGVCFSVGARLMGAMPYLAMTSAVGVLTIVMMRTLRGGPVRELWMVSGRVAVAGFFGVAVYSVMLGEAAGLAKDRELGQVMLLNYLWPIWIVVLGLLMLETKANVGMVLAGAFLGFGGLVVAKGVGTLWQRPASWWPHALAFGGGFLWALYSVLIRRWKIPAARAGSTFHFAVCAVLAAVVGVACGEWGRVRELDWRGVTWVLFGGIGPVGLAYHWWEIGIKRGRAHLIALLAYLIPIGSAALIGVFFREAMSGALLVGAAMIAAGAWMGHWGTKETMNDKR